MLCLGGTRSPSDLNMQHDFGKEGELVMANVDRQRNTKLGESVILQLSMQQSHFEV